MKPNSDIRQRRENLKTLLYGAKTFFIAQDMERALMCTEVALAFSPQHVEALTNKGTLLANAGDLSGALEIFEQAMKIDNGYRMAQVNFFETLKELARECARSGNFAQAMATFRQCLAINPSNNECKGDLAALTFMSQSVRQRVGKALHRSKRLKSTKT